MAVLLIDDILLAPARAVQFIVRQIHNAALEERENEAGALRAQLSDLYVMLERHQITESEFDARERELLDRLEQIEARGMPGRGEAQTAD